MSAARALLRRCCTLDTRTLAVFRIAIALCVLGDLAIRYDDLEAHYTDFGTVPVELARAELRPPWRLSLHTFDGSAGCQTGLFALHAALAVSLLVGFMSRLSAVLVWLMLVSLEARNGMLAQGGDTYMRCMVFWAMFTPLGARFSVDRLRARTAPVLPTTYSAATVALLLQVAYLYVFTALWKHGDSWLHGDALYYTLYRDQQVHRLGVWARQAPLWVLTASTYFALAGEALGPLLLLQPRPRGRWIGIAWLAALHVGIGLTVKVGMFSLIALACLLLFMPPSVWQLSAGLAATAPRGPLAEPSATPWTRVRDAIVGTLVVYTLIWNVDGLVDARLIPRPLREVGFTLRIRQQWMMFAPGPPKFDGWWVARGRLADGQTRDLLTGRAVTWDKPALISETYPSYRWRKYVRRVGRSNFARFRPHWARYLCNRHNRAAPPGQWVREVELWHLTQRIRRNRRYGETKRRLRTHYRCE